MPSRAPIRDRVKYLPPTRISGVGETSGFDPATMKDQLIWSPRCPLLASAPATVVNGQRFRLAEAGREFGREYLGVAGAWVPQDSVTMGVWRSKKCGRLNGVLGSAIFTPTATIKTDSDFIAEVQMSDSTLAGYEDIFQSVGVSGGVGSYGYLVAVRLNGIPETVLGVEGVTYTENMNIPDVQAFQMLKFEYTALTRTVRLYVDGVLFATKTLSAGVQTVYSGFRVGNGVNAANKSNALFSSAKISGSNGTLYWDMEDINGSTIPDRSGNGNAGTVANVTTEYAWVPLS